MPDIGFAVRSLPAERANATRMGIDQRCADRRTNGEAKIAGGNVVRRHRAVPGSTISVPIRTKPSSASSPRPISLKYCESQRFS